MNNHIEGCGLCHTANCEHTESKLADKFGPQKSMHLAIGTAVARAREASGMSQSDLARMANVSRANISNLEHGKQGVSVEVLYRIALAVCVPMADLLPQLVTCPTCNGAGVLERDR